jgi:hypothetical protein
VIFLESPWPAIIVGGVAELILVIILICTGRGVLLWAVAGVALLTGFGVLVERLVVTDRKLITRTLEEAASAVEANDLARVLRVIAADATETREAARTGLAEAEVVRAQIRSLDIEVGGGKGPPVAKARFLVLATGRGRHEALGEMTELFRVEVVFRWEGGRWLITGHRLSDGLRGQ